ncbi:MAG: hypothetical protein K6E28_06165 [Eubacterium sp.]|nr:hypothetical protein [Eubacterium sp.]
MISTNDIKNEELNLEECLNNALYELSRLKKDTPDGGSLRAVKYGDKYQYFYRRRGEKKSGEYIKNADRNKAILLAEIEYYEKLQKKLQKMLQELRDLMKVWVDNPYNEIASTMSEGKRLLIEVPYESDEEFIHKWKSQEYKSLSFREDCPEYYTGQGLRVRSKSEIIIADFMNEMDVPFLYEKPLSLKGEIIYPDFTLLDIVDRKEVYWEHFGMMDDMDYRNNAFSKIRKYEACGFYQHDSLFWTFETGKNPLNTRVLREMIKRLKGKLGY